jgi:hypothetical protein
MKLVLALILACGTMLAQFGPEVTISQLPAPNPGEIIYGYSGSNLIYACYSKSAWQLSGPISISAATNANPVVFTSTGHGFNVNALPIVVIAGGTGNWTAVNGSFTATIIDANTFSIPVNSTAFGALTGTLTFQTTAPRTNQKQWAVQMYYYSGANLIFTAWLNGSPAVGSSKCSDATTVGVNVQ